MKKGIPCLAVLLIVALKASAWGPTGHRVTGWIAEKYLSKEARKTVARILDGQSLAMASTWMDEVRSDSAYSYMTDWHWVTIPEGVPYEQAVKNPAGDLIQTLERVLAELKNHPRDSDKHREYLRILVHLVGDIHQPLHVGSRPDRGGNDVRVWWFGNTTNLHRVWDSDMIDDSRLSYTELAESLETPSRELIKTWQQSSVQDWARESQSYERQVYRYGDGRLGYHYSYVNFPAVRKRLLQAGVRLAGILNALYG